jgi:hypothetical protein
LANSLRFLLRLGVSKVREIAAHQATRRIAVADASFMIEIGDLPQPAEAYPSRPASSIEGFEKDPTYVGIGCCTGLGVIRTSSKE